MAIQESTTTLDRFALRHTPTGELVRIASFRNEDADYCGEHRYELGLSSDYPVYTRSTTQKLERVLARDIPWYNSDYRSPMHGSLKAEDLEIVRYVVTTTTTIEPVTFNRMPTLQCITTERKTQRLAARYAGRDLPEEAYILRTFLMPEGKTMADMKALEGSLVKIQHDACIQLFAVFEAPEEYTLDFKGQPGFCAISGDSQYLG